jgi:hypothetical protein
MAGAATRANTAPTAAAVIATALASTSICCISRARPAPIDRRSAISRSRAAARASIRFARLEHASRSTSVTTAARIHKGRS